MQNVQKSSSDLATKLEDMGDNIAQELDEIKSSTTQRLNSLIDFHSKSFFEKLSGKPEQTS